MNNEIKEIEALDQVTRTETSEPKETDSTVISTQLSKKELLREMSKEYNVNLFDAEGLAKFKEYQDAQKTEREKLQEQLETFKSRETEYNSTKENYEAKIAGLELGISSDKLNDALALAKINMTEGQTIKEGLQAVKEKYGNMFSSEKGVASTIQIGTQKDEDEEGLNIELDPALARYRANKNKRHR